MDPLPSNSHETKKIFIEAHSRERGELVTKHDRSVCEQHNAWRVGRFTGDLDGMDLPDRPYNELKDHFHSEIRRDRRGGKVKVSRPRSASKGDDGVDVVIDHTDDAANHHSDDEKGEEEFASVKVPMNVTTEGAVSAPTANIIIAPACIDGDWEVLAHSPKAVQPIPPAVEKDDIPVLTSPEESPPPKEALQPASQVDLQALVDHLIKENKALRTQVIQLQDFSKGQVRRVSQLEAALQKASTQK